MWLFATHFHFMALNVLLAYIPIELSYLLNAEKRKRDWLIGFAWLIFYPNAPYLFTDFFHLETLSIYRGFNTIFVNQIGDWWAFVCLTSGIVIYGLLGMKTVTTVSQKLQSYCDYRTIVVFQASLHFLSALAIYVGRFDRLHSVYLFMSPIETVKIIFFDWSLQKLMFILLMMFLQMLLFGLIQLLGKEEAM
ncbi:TPA: DUF1361 domain-containing protein [Enterococcus faecalis]|uniref:DUF1361 domain-containing protein n=1 Tax=Enterococcus faecalis TaxID=1351 RepID=UPI00157310BA|nr:DUF1361 domain-containing protein [Enterococcus faecalis]NSO30934.1 DUF1361 domain-containing protein [Enterococcus faecalis]HAP4876957.1 DUF1361 domain-containing protein [Enterococcus faecalis]